jgi:hypothetical protein
MNACRAEEAFCTWTVPLVPPMLTLEIVSALAPRFAPATITKPSLGIEKLP